MKWATMIGSMSFLAMAACTATADRAVEVSAGGTRAIEEPLELDTALTEFLVPFTASADFSGVAVAARGDEIIGLQSSPGIAEASPGGSALDTRFHVASISKTFTAAAIRRLAEEGALGLDDPLSRFLPDFPNADRITIGHLLGHESGVADFWAIPGVWSFAAEPVRLEELVLWIGQRPLDFEPGTASRYSNSGYTLLAAVIEHVSGQSYHDYLSREILRPMNLASTDRFDHDASVAGFAPGSGESRLAPSERYDPSILVGSGALKSTARDLLRWCAELNADFHNTETAPFLFGWGARAGEGRRWAEQSGRAPGFASHVRAYPDEDLCVVVLNRIESESVGAIGAGIAAMAAGNTPPRPPVRAPYPLSPAQMSELVGLYDSGAGGPIEVAIRSGALVLRGNNGPFLALDAIGEDQFFFRQLHVPIAARRNEDGRVAELLWANEYPMRRVTPR